MFLSLQFREPDQTISTLMIYGTLPLLSLCDISKCLAMACRSSTGSPSCDVMVRGHDRQVIFRDDRDREAYLARLQGVAEHGRPHRACLALLPNYSPLAPDPNPSLGRDCRYPAPIRLPGRAAMSRGGGGVEEIPAKVTKVATSPKVPMV